MRVSCSSPPDASRAVALAVIRDGCLGCHGSLWMRACAEAAPYRDHVPPREFLMALACQSGRVIGHGRIWRTLLRADQTWPLIWQVVSVLTIVPGLMKIGGCPPISGG